MDQDLQWQRGLASAFFEAAHVDAAHSQGWNARSLRCTSVSQVLASPQPRPVKSARDRAGRGQGSCVFHRFPHDSNVHIMLRTLDHIIWIYLPWLLK